jgi:DNA-binding transcriptional ArsR family regulator
MNTNRIAAIAALVGEPARAAMLLELMDGRALTARELARAGNVTPQTASQHLSRLVEAGLMQMEQHGRHRFHRLASAEVAKVLEGIMQLAAGQPAPRAVTPGPRDDALRRARMCYDHIAGRLGLAIAETLQADGAIVFQEDGGTVMPEAAGVLSRWRLALPPPAPRAARVYCRPCLDWSERKPHIAGRLGALLCSHCLEQGWLQRRPGHRALAITPEGESALRELLGPDAWERVAQPAASRK